MTTLEKQAIRQTIRCRLVPLSVDTIRLLLDEYDAMMDRVVVK